jgi:hypothetical protein
MSMEMQMEFARIVKHCGWYEIIAALVQCGAIPGTSHRILLYGPPGTGKTTCPFKLFNGQVESMTMHQQLPPDDMIGSMGLVEENGATTTVWQDGPAIRAMRAGKPLVINEISRRSPECESALYNVLDDLEICSVTLPNGETVTPERGYCVFATMNDEPSCLPEAIQERFDIVLMANKPAPGILDRLGKFNHLVARHYDGLTQNSKPWTPSIGARSVMAAVRMGNVIGQEAAFTLKFGHKGVDVLANVATAE